MIQQASFPERVGRYELLVPLGSGGMASVYLAQREVVEGVFRDFAVKLLHAHLLADDEGAARILIDEAKLAAAIRHPNVVPVVEVDEDRGSLFLVMEYVEGDTLSALIRAARARGEPVPLAIAARILLDVCDGLHAAHEALGPDGELLNLVHRDVSPQNILVGTDGLARLTDFGIARAATRSAATASGVIKGKIGYVSPEQARGRPLDRRSDVWAAGVVAWELLASRRLFHGDDSVATLLRIAQEPAPRVRSARPALPQALDDALARSLAIAADERTPSALSLRSELLAACREAEPPADAAAVGAYVRSLLAARLEERARQIREARRAPRAAARQARAAAQDEATLTDATAPQAPFALAAASHAPAQAMQAAQAAQAMQAAQAAPDAPDAQAAQATPSAQAAQAMQAAQAAPDAVAEPPALDDAPPPARAHGEAATRPLGPAPRAAGGPVPRPRPWRLLGALAVAVAAAASLRLWERAGLGTATAAQAGGAASAPAASSLAAAPAGLAPAGAEAAGAVATATAAATMAAAATMVAPAASAPAATSTARRRGGAPKAEGKRGPGLAPTPYER